MTDTSNSEQAADALLTRSGRPAAELWPDSGLVHLNHGSYGRVPLAATPRDTAACSAPPDSSRHHDRRHLDELLAARQ